MDFESMSDDELRQLIQDSPKPMIVLGARKELRKREGAKLPKDSVLSNFKPGASDFARMAAQGVTLGFGDELEAAARAPFSDQSYADIRNDLRERIAATRSDSPMLSNTLEFGGGMATAGLTLPGQTLRAGQLMRQGMPGAAKIGAQTGGTFGGIAGLGYSEEETTPGMLLDTAVGAGAGAGIGAAAQPLLAGAGSKLTQFTDFLRRRMGADPDNAMSRQVATELARLRAQTGKDTSQLIDDLMQGRIIAEDPVLAGMVRNFRTGQGGGMVDDVLQRRAVEQPQAARQAVQSELLRDSGVQVGDNLRKVIAMSDEEMIEASRKAYSGIWGQNNGGEVSDDIASAMADLWTRSTEIQKRFNRIAKASKRPSPFGLNEDGELVQKRAVTLFDAENFDRALREEIDLAFNKGETTLAQILRQSQERFRPLLDDFSPELATVRAEFATQERIRQAYKDGEKIFFASRSPDDVAMDLERIRAMGDPRIEQAYRLGAAIAVGKKSRPTGSVGRMSKEDDPYMQSLQNVIGEERYEPLATQLRNAQDSINAKNQITGNSQTANQLQAAANVGTPIGQAAVEVAETAMTGQPALSTLMRIAMRVGRRKGVQLTPEQNEQILRVVLSEDPQLVQRAMNSADGLLEIERSIDRFITARVLGGAGAASAAQLPQMPQR